MRNAGLSMEQVDQLLNKQSGLKGLCGHNDMREILAGMEQGNAQDKLAVEMMVYRLQKYIGAYLAILGGLDGLVFTAGIGEHSPQIRELVCQGLEHLGLKLDLAKNASPGPGAQVISQAKSPVALLVVPTNEELKIAREVHKLVQG